MPHVLREPGPAAPSVRGPQGSAQTVFPLTQSGEPYQHLVLSPARGVALNKPVKLGARFRQGETGTNWNGVCPVGTGSTEAQRGRCEAPQGLGAWFL